MTLMKQLVAVVERNEKKFWTRIGVAFENRDGSWNLRFDYFPTDPRVTVQLRDFRKEETGGVVDETPEATRGVSAQPF